MIKCFITNYKKNEYFKSYELKKQYTNENKKSLISIDYNETKQTLVGFGGAFTESSAVVFNQASKSIQDEILKLYFDKEEGLGYELGRIAIGSCDFSLDNYMYINDGDFTLDYFSIERDEKLTIPFVLNAMKYSKNLKMALAPWSPPKHLKTNNNLNNGGKLKEEYYDFYCEYIIKFIKELIKKGINIEYLSLQNEPEANQTWDSCLYTPEEMIKLVKVMYPKLINNNLDIKILILDHNRDILVKWAKAVSVDKEALNMIWGLAIHWYVSEDFNQLSLAKKLVPNLNILFTEGCIEGGPRPYEVYTGERYARNIIGDLNNGCVGYIDWNLILNEQGGPNHKNNYCDAPMLLKNDGSLIINSSYYYIGHFAKFLKNGSKIVKSSINNSYLQVLAAISSKNEKILIICNPNDEDISYEFNNENELITYYIEAHTIQTLVLK